MMDQERLEIINFANNCFGDSGWSFSISNIVLDYLDENRPANYFSAGTSAVVRVQRADGVFREDVGYGSSSGSLKADVISKSKKDAVTNGLLGAINYFGGRVAEKFRSVSLLKREKDKCSVESITAPTASNNHLQTPSKLSYDARTTAGVRSVEEATACQSETKIPPQVPPTSPVVAAKIPPAPQISPGVTAIPRTSLPVAKPLSAPSDAKLSEEELAKIERKRRQRQRQEEFRQKHLLEQLQAQSKAQVKQISKSECQQPRAPLKEHQLEQPPKVNAKGTGGGGTTNALDVDDDVLLSTQDMEAVLQKADNNPISARRVPMISSPSFSRHESVRSPISRSASGHKRPDTSNFAPAAEKKPRGM